MIKAKQQINISHILKFLQEKFDASSSNIQPINEGETSAAFFFNANGKEYVIRIGGNLEHFEKDRFADQHFSSSLLPIPKIIALGIFEEDMHYIISEKVEGNLFFTFQGNKFQNLLPHFIETLDAIHATDISMYSGYGDWDKKGKAFFSSWKAFLEGIQDEDYFHWQNVFKETYFTEQVYNELLKQFQSLLPFCPEERRLVHGDFGVNNVLAKGNRITAVLDWGLSSYGDFLYDIAWIDFWPAQVPFGKVFLEHYKKKGVNVENFQERMLCYKIHFAIGSMHFAVTSNNKEMYDYIRKRITEEIKGNIKSS